MAGTAARLADTIREMIPRWRRPTMSPMEMDLALDLRGNDRLYMALTTIIQERIDGRAALPVPKSPDDCRAYLERDRECRMIMKHLELVYRSAVNAADSGEPPAA